jgi:hypothetical protein
MYIYFFIIYIEIFLFFSIVSQDSTTISKKIEFNGVYRIHSLLNGYSLADEDNSLQFSNQSKDKISQIFRIYPSKDNLFIIETRYGRRKLGTNQQGQVLMVFDPDHKRYKRSKWNIISIAENEYLIQNDGNKKFMEINNNFIQCIKDLPLPIEQHKSEININFKFKFFTFYEEVIITPE